MATAVKHTSTTARAFAQSLLELASETGSEVAVGQELEQIGQVLAENKTFSMYLADPGISNDERGRTLRNVFGGRASPLLLNTILVLNQQGKSRELSGLVDAYDQLLEEKLGKIEVDVTVASRLEAGELEEVRQMVGRALKKDAVVHQYVDESIIGGLILKVGDQMIDGSVKTQLNQIRQKLLTSRSK